MVAGIGFCLTRALDSTWIFFIPGDGFWCRSSEKSKAQNANIKQLAKRLPWNSQRGGLITSTGMAPVVLVLPGTGLCRPGDGWWVLVAVVACHYVFYHWSRPRDNKNQYQACTRYQPPACDRWPSQRNNWRKATAANAVQSVLNRLPRAVNNKDK